MCDTKKCTKCGRELPLDQFYKRSDRDSYQSWCRGCCGVADSRRAKQNKEKKNASSRRWRRANPGKHRAAVARWRENNPEKAKANNAEWRENNSDKCLANARRWRENNPEDYRASGARWRENNPGHSTDYARKRGATDPAFRMINNIRHGITKALKRNTKSGHTIELLGCSIEYLRYHLENQFTEGMTWDNYGLYGWHIDHIIPVSYFDHSDPEQQKRAWHYTNLQPLWAKDNLRKWKHIEEYQLVLL